MATTPKNGATTASQPIVGPLTAREIEVLAAAFCCMKERPTAASIDIQKYKEIAGFKSDGGAKNAYYNIVKKLTAFYAKPQTDVDDDAAGAAVPAVTPKKAGRPKKIVKSEENIDGDDELAMPATPGGGNVTDTPMTPGTPSTSPVKRSASDAADGESPVKKARTPRKPKLDENGNPIPPKPRAPRKSKVDEDGNPIPPKPRAPRKKKAAEVPEVPEVKSDAVLEVDDAELLGEEADGGFGDDTIMEDTEDRAAIIDATAF